VFRTVNDQPTLWDAILPCELLVLPVELARVDALLDDPVFFAPFAGYFDARMGRPSIPMETYLRLMFLKFRYRLGYELLCREVADSISWQRFCRIPLGVRVPHPTTLMKISSRCGEAAVAGLNAALVAKAAVGKLLRTDKVRADTTVVCADVGYPTDSGLLAKGIGAIAGTVARIKAAGGASGTRVRVGAARRVGGLARLPLSCGCAAPSNAMRLRPRCAGSPGNWRTSPRPRWVRRSRCCAMPAVGCVVPPGCAKVDWLARSTIWTPWWGAPGRWWPRPAAGWPG
jgi:IS5 family transposase